MSRKVTYHPIVKWRCHWCTRRNEVHINYSDGPLEIWNKVVSAHLEQCSDCHLLHKDSGIGTEQLTSGTLPLE